MSKILNFNLFPKNEDFGTGEESLDQKLTLQLKELNQDLSIEKIIAFYHYTINLKTRISNPVFKIQVEHILKALIHSLDENLFVDDEVLKIKGDYLNKKKIDFNLEKVDILIDGLKMMGKFRYNDVLDFFLEKQNEKMLNPYVSGPININPYKLDVKIIMKDIRRALAKEIPLTNHNDFLQALVGGENILVIKNLGEIWFHQDKIFSIYKI